MGQIVDTSIVVSLERRKAPRGTLLSIGDDSGWGIAAVGVAELLVGVHRAPTERLRTERQSYLDAVLDDVPVIPFDARIADTYARLLVYLRERGTMVGIHDLQIAATALSLGYAVLTDNVKDFERVPGLEVRRPNWPE